ncbi:MAG TPA: sigma-54 dependent transcriptional regulator [Luteitalea sp.]|nr:sigma-54 dependent transcriptional regulator [Luteitalea sp.]
MTDTPAPVTLDPLRLLEPAIVVLRAETDAREGLEALLAQLYGIKGAAIHLRDEPLRMDRGRLLLPGGSESLRVTAAGPADVVARTRQVVALLHALVPLLRDAERKADTRSVLEAVDANHGGLLGVTPVMRQLHERIARAARKSFTVLIQGESGAGKELVARQVHALSTRCSGPFVPINCAAIVESLLEAELFGIEERTATGVRGRRGRFEQADGGTLFLDEVSDLSASAQAKLLRIIQDPTVERVGGHGSRRVDVRIVAATNRPLQTLCKSGEFRRDLFYRLNAIEIDVPPLRARRDDIPYLCEAILQRSSDGQSYRIAPTALEALMVYEWPGNVRELERVLERAITLAGGEAIQIDDLPSDVTGRYREAFAAVDEHDDTMRAWGSRHARMVLRRTNGNKREACRILDISYHTLQAYLAYKGPRGDAGRTEPPDVGPYDSRGAGGPSMVHDGGPGDARHLDTPVLE